MKNLSTIFIADVHLRPEAPEVTRLFVQFLRHWRTRAEAIWILGDLFDIWMGPRHIELPDYQPVLGELAGLTASGVRLSLLRGNRDFHIDERLGKQIGATVHRESVIVDIAGKRMLLTHGDFLCLNDRWNTVYRALVRSDLVMRLYRALPVSFGRFLAYGTRGHSRRALRRKSSRVVTLAPSAIRRQFDSGIDTIICGHAHRQEHLRVPTARGTKDLYLLGTWKSSGSYAELRASTTISLGQYSGGEG